MACFCLKFGCASDVCCRRHAFLGDASNKRQSRLSHTCNRRRALQVVQKVMVMVMMMMMMMLMMMTIMNVTFSLTHYVPQRSGRRHDCHKPEISHHQQDGCSARPPYAVPVHRNFRTRSIMKHNPQTRQITSSNPNPMSEPCL